MSFSLDAELDRISTLVADLAVSQLRLMRDQRFLWVMLIPRVADATEWHQLSAEEMAVHAEEIRVVSLALTLGHDQTEVVNAGMFGHGVRQLHVHMAARHSADPLWPKIAFMTGPPDERSQADQDEAVELFRRSLQVAAERLDSTLLNVEPVTP